MGSYDEFGEVSNDVKEMMAGETADSSLGVETDGATSPQKDESADDVIESINDDFEVAGEPEGSDEPESLKHDAADEGSEVVEEPAPVAETETTSEADPKAEAEISEEPELVPELEPETESESDTEAEVEAELEVEAETELEVEAESELEVEAEAELEVEAEAETEVDEDVNSSTEAEEIAGSVNIPVSDGTPVGMFQLNCEGRLVFANSAFLAMFGAASENDFMAAVSQTDGDGSSAARQFMEALAAAAAQGGASGSKLPHPEPSQNLDLNVWLTPVGEVWNGCVTATGKSEVRVSAEQETENVSVAQPELFSMLGEKMRTPVNGIIGMADYLEGTELSKDQLRYTNVIRQGAESILAVVDDVLEFSKAETGTLDLEPAKSDLHALVEDVIEAHASAARDKALQSGVAIDSNVPKHVVVDAGRLRQVLDTLFGNAVKYTSAGGILLELSQLSRSEGRALLRFTISDTGVGISEDQQAEIFSGLSLSSALGETESGKAGLGLPFSRAVVEQMGGEIKLHSVPGEGTTFCIELELDVVAQEGETNIEKDELEALAARRVLAVDDSAINRMVLARQLESLGMRPTVVPSASEAMHALTQARELGDPFEIAILDHFMVGIDGVELCVRIRDTAGFADMKIVLASSAGPMDADRKLPANGFDALLSKPLRPSATRAALRGLYSDGLEGTTVHTLGAQFQAASTSENKPDTVQESARRESVREQAAMLMEMFGEASDNENVAVHGAGPVEASTKSADKPRILVAEDNHVNQQLAELILVTNGYDVRIVEDGVKAVAAVQEEEFDLVLMDIQMPNMDGLDATREIRKLEGDASAVPVIALTANVMPGDADVCFEAGMDSYVAKPVRQDLLLEEMRKFLKADKKLSVVA